MAQNSRRVAFAFFLIVGIAAPLAHAQTDNIIKLGLSVPLSGSGANWGRGSDWLCRQAAAEIQKAGGVKVAGKTYNYQCIAYDNKYNAAEGTKVAQTLLSRDDVKFVAGVIGTAPSRTLQSLTEREGVLMFTSGWGASNKGPNYPLTFTQMNTPVEISPPLVKYVKQANPTVKTVALLNPNDATGQETEKLARKAWEAAGVKVVTSDWYERGTTEFQPIAAKLAGLKPDAVDLCSSPPADGGLVFKELGALGWKGVKVVEVGTGADGLLATGGPAADGAYLGAAITFDGPNATAHQRELNQGMRALTGESINAIQIGFYDSVQALKVAMEKSQSLDPPIVAKTLPTITFNSFYGRAAFGEKAVYGSPQQILVPVVVTQIQGTKLVELARLAPPELQARVSQ